MRFFPLEYLIYESELSESVIKNNISHNIEPKKTFRIGLKNNQSKPYEGYLKENTFKIKRIINNKNSFRPIIIGEISQICGSTQIKVKMRMYIIAYIFMTIWFGGVGFGLITLLKSCIDENKFEPAIFVPLGMLLAGYLMMIVSFKFESRKSKNDLEEILNSKLIK